MTDQLTAVLTELQSLRNELTELKQMVKGQPLDKEDKLPITEGLEGRIAALLQSLKISASLKGYVYLREAIRMVYEQFGMVEGMTKIVYPTIARKFNTLPARVERDIRHAIEKAWMKNPSHSLFEHYPSAKPTNSQFISMIADKFILEGTEMETVGQN